MNIKQPRANKKKDHDKKHLRQHFRARRRKLSRSQQQHAALMLCKNLLRILDTSKLKTIACYNASDGEISLSPFIQACLKKGIKCFTPTIRPNNSMSFHQYSGNYALQKNIYGILEAPNSAKTIQAHKFDLVLLPLVAFDKNGRRLGMGGGYYDRCFEFLNHNRGPILIGVSHHCQQSKNLPEDVWDISLKHIVSDKNIIECH
ncbi:MAG: 5-formyltetrahydrofolate cyclo-ligase [Flavobacteriales bacterium]|jgi:5-formyltetrahydrofolate cyclo-ligase